MVYIYWDIKNHIFITSLANTQEVSQFDWVLRDKFPVQLYIVQPDDTTLEYTQQEAPSGFSVKFSCKVAGSLDGAPLVFQGTWTLQGSGATAYYTADVDLNTVALIAAVAASSTTDELDIVGEFTFENAAGQNQDSTQVTIRIAADVHRSTDATPASYSPLWQEYTNANGAKCLRIMNSDGQTLAVLTPPGEEP